MAKIRALRGIGQGAGQWNVGLVTDHESGPRQCQTVTPSSAMPLAAGSGSQSVLVAFQTRAISGDMDRRHGLIRHTVFGLQTLSTIVFAMALIMSQLSWAATSLVTIGGPFTLTAPDGTTVTDQTYRGKWLLVYFGYTFCPDSCPTTLNEIASALEKLGADAVKLKPLFITIDPQRDTREVLEQYTQSFDPRIVGLTGSPQQIDAVTQGYGAYAARHKTGPGSEDYVMDHSTYLYVMDPGGKFVRAFDADTSGDRIADALRKLMARPGG
jgi:protein SCO1